MIHTEPTRLGMCAVSHDACLPRARNLQQPEDRRPSATVSPATAAYPNGATMRLDTTQLAVTIRNRSMPPSETRSRRSIAAGHE